MMQARPLRGLAVSRLGFGGASLGNLYLETPDAQARASVDAAWDGGVRYFDTAPHYGLGLSERRLGAALAGRPRADYVLSTKVGRLLVPNKAPTGSDLEAGGFAVPDDLVRRFDFSRDGVLRSLEASLDRLGVGRVDIVYVHDPDEHMDQAIAEAIPALAELRDQGVVGAVGAGMNQWQALRRMVREADLDVVMLAGRWTLLDRSGAPLLAACAERGVAVVAAAPYNSGLLARSRRPFQLRACPRGGPGPGEVARGHLPAARHPPAGGCPAVPPAASGGHRGGRRDADGRRGERGSAAAGRTGARGGMGRANLTARTRWRSPPSRDSGGVGSETHPFRQDQRLCI
jgi:D-threo-aldose 1-dehydrogenase